MITLGGNIELVGFKDEDSATMAIIRKMVGNYARKMTETTKNFEKLTVSMKKVHEIEDSKKYEIQASLLAGKQFASEITDKNLFFAIDKVLSKIISEIGHG